MQKQDKQSYAPKLRFSEFKGNWVNYCLRDISKIYDGTHQTPRYVKKGIPFYSVEHVTANQFVETKFISEEVYLNECKRIILEKDDILMTRIGSVGVVKYIDWDVSASFYVSLALIKIANKFHAEFISHVLSSGYFQRELWKRTIHVAFPVKINLGEIGFCLLYLPKLKEQQKIADFLSVVDTKIDQLEKKKTLLQDYKKGMMQKLFNQEIRFKDKEGNDYTKWKNTLFGELYSFIPTNSLSRDKLNNDKVGIANIHYGDVHTKYSAWFDIEKEDVTCLNDDVDVSNVKPERFCQEGDIIFADASEDYDDIGKAIEVCSLGDKKMLSGLHTLLARPKYRHARGFFTYFLQSWGIRKQMMKFAQGTKVLGITSGRIAKFSIAIPSERNEQQKIANFLFSIDQKIQQIEQQLKQAKTFKKGLLQQMFV